MASFRESITTANVKGITAFEDAVRQLRGVAMHDGDLDAARVAIIDNAEASARQVLFGPDTKSGIAANILAAQDAGQGVTAIENAMKTALRSESKSGGQLIAAYLLGVAHHLKADCPEFEREFDKEKTR